MHRLTAGLLAPLLALAAAPALADTGRGVSGAEAMAVLQAMDLEPEMLEDSVGDPMIRFQTNGLNAYLNFYDCSADRCGSLQLEVGLTWKRPRALANVTTRLSYGGGARRRDGPSSLRIRRLHAEMRRNPSKVGRRRCWEFTARRIRPAATGRGRAVRCGGWQS